VVDVFKIAVKVKVFPEDTYFVLQKLMYTFANSWNV